MFIIYFSNLLMFSEEKNYYLDLPFMTDTYNR